MDLDLVFINRSWCLENRPRAQLSENLFSQRQWCGITYICCL